MKKYGKGLLGLCMVGMLAGCTANAGESQKETGALLTPEISVETTLTPEATQAPEEAVTPVPTATPKPTPTPVPAPYVDESYWQGVLDGFADSKYDLSAALLGPALKDWCKGYFKLGVGLTGYAYENMAIHSREYMTVAEKHFNSCTLTNLMKPSYILNQAGSMKNALEGKEEPVLDFSGIDEILQWCVDTGVQMRGHTLVWHTQTPDWYFREGYKNDGEYVDRETMLFRLDSYIGQLLTYCQDNYPGAIYCWDVVNEAVDPDNGDKNSFYLCRMENEGTPNPWYHVVGDDYVEQAFRIARKYAAEGVSLFYNDFNTFQSVKRDNIYNLCKHLAEEGLIDGIGMQGYWSTTYPSTSEIERAIKKFAELGLEIQITEMSIDAPDLTEEGLKKQAERYGSMFYMLGNLDTQGGGPANITSVTLFGLMDGYVLYGGSDKTTSRIFDADFRPKPAFERIERIMCNTYKNRE
ncbi:MAG: endo-1,4-beta-xylanase [Lachnospiraceae bacterium]|nr:endo-1,4-beta-xylanase [Lachnospiraceae bacterium]